TLANRGRPANQPAILTATMAPAPARKAALAEGRARMLAADALGVEKQKEVIKEALSEYFLYTVEGRDTIPNGWAKRLPSFKTDGVPLTSYYKYEKERFGEQVMRY